jgi:hypothetical protein
MNRSVGFTGAAVITDDEGEAVSIVTCKLCGAAVFIDQRDEFDARQLHIDWHEARKGEGG